MSHRLELIALKNFPLVQPGDDLAQLILSALETNELELDDGDVLVLAQKIVSKAENRYRRLEDVEVSPQGQALAEQADKDPRQAQLILDESREVLRVRPGVVIVEHRHGYVHANAGIDKSNIPHDEQDPSVLLLPAQPDNSARMLLEQLVAVTGASMALIISDSAGRAWRNGTTGFALATAGIEPVRNQIGDKDLFGRVLEVTEVAVADELAAAASLLMGQAAEACPVVLVRGATWTPADCGSASLIRDREMDLFR